jgi:two-component system NtrC family sensor kinase
VPPVLIFKPFFSTKTGGTGLGLPLTQQIIIEHDGFIECESVQGKGTTFIIRLPQARES